MKDNETILVSFETQIDILKVEEKKMNLKEYLTNIKICPPGIIMNFGEGFVWAFEEIIYFSHGKYYSVYIESEENYLDKKMRINIVCLFEYNEDIILYLYLFLDDGCGYNCLHFNLYNKKGNNLKDIIINDDKYSCYTLEDSNLYKIYNFGKNEVIIASLNYINIINLSSWGIISSIPFPNSRINYNSYSFNNSYFLFFLNNGKINLNRREDYEQNNMMIIKIKKDYNKILYNDFLDIEKTADLYYNTINKEFIPTSQIISIEEKNINFYEIKLNIKKNINLKIENK